MKPSYLLVDESVANRIDYWEAALKMIADSPFSGWGVGESGQVFNDFYQGLERDEAINSLVNSFLTYSAELGLWVLFVCLFVAFYILKLGSTLSYRGGIIATASTAVIVTWIVSNVFSVICEDVTMWVLPVISCLFLIYSCKGRSFDDFHRSTGVYSCIFYAAILCAITYVAGVSFSISDEWSVCKKGNTVVLENRIDSLDDEDVYHVWIDEKVLGPSPGKEIRKLFGSCDRSLRIHLYDPANRELQIAGNGEGEFVLFGDQCQRFERIIKKFPAASLSIIHPAVIPRWDSIGVDVQSAMRIVLPGIDEVGVNDAWRELARGNNITIIESCCGIDIRNCEVAFWFD